MQTNLHISLYTAISRMTSSMGKPKSINTLPHNTETYAQHFSLKYPPRFTVFVYFPSIPHSTH